MTRTATGLRLFIALVCAATAAGKLIDVRGFADVLRSYAVFPERWLFPLAVGIALVEVGLAIWLFSGRRTAAAAMASVVMHGGYAVWSATGVLRGLELPNCGCFGVFLARPLGWATVGEDVVLVGLSVWLFRLARTSA